MAGVLLILSEMRNGTAVVDRAIEKAAATNSELIVLSILDPAVLNKAAARLTEQGQVGTTPSRGMVESASTRHEQIARQEIADVVARADSASVKTRTICRRGDHVREATEVINEELPCVVIAEKQPRSILRMRSTNTFLSGLSEKVGFDLLEI
jgi:hypothetical protein